MYYPEEVIAEVRDGNNIVDVISGYVQLKKKGSNYFGLCPFHHEKTGSFSVSPSKQMYHCFGCGAGGNVITFVMEYENYSFREAVQMLADRAGVTLPKIEYTREQKAEQDLKASLLEINRQAANYYYYQLKQPHGEAGYRYLSGRGLSDETIRNFGLGYSNKTPDDLYRYLRGKGYNDELLAQTGLFTITERGTRDKFWNRVMFPILDINNHVIGFGGRVMGDGEPKYLNSPETKIFDKGRNLYGLNYARKSRAGCILLCEGYMDVIAMHQAGFTNAVASLGTALTERHAALLKRYTDQVILTYDSDGAGVAAALRAIPILRASGISTKVLHMEPYKDPDEFIKNLGKEEFEKRIEEAENSFLFRIGRLRDRYRMNDPEQKTEFYRQTAGCLLEFEEALERENYIQAVAQEFMIPFESLKKLVNQYGNRFGSGETASAKARGIPVREVSPAAPPESLPYGEEGEEGERRAVFSPGAAPAAARGKKTRDDGIRRSERILLTGLIEKPELIERLKGVISPEDFSDGLYRSAAEKVFAGYEKGNLNPAAILDQFIDDEGSYREVAALFSASLEGIGEQEDRKKAFSETVKRVRRNSLEIQIGRAEDIAVLQKLVAAKTALENLTLRLD